MASPFLMTSISLQVHERQACVTVGPPIKYIRSTRISVQINGQGCPHFGVDLQYKANTGHFKCS